MNQKYMRFIALGALLITTVLGVVTVNATWQSANSFAWCGTDLDMFAQDGDVVTTDKWNQSFCYVRGVYSALVDWPSGNNPFIVFGNSLLNPGKFLTTSINLPSNTTAVTNPVWPGLGGTLQWRDASMNYDPGIGAGWKGGIAYNDTDDTLNLVWFDGWLNIIDATISKKYKLAWEKVDINDAVSFFNSECTYKVNTNLLPNAFVTSVASQPSDIAFVLDGWRYFSITYWSKISATLVDPNATPVTSTIVVNYLYKSCFPAYN